MNCLSYKHFPRFPFPHWCVFLPSPLIKPAFLRLLLFLLCVALHHLSHLSSVFPAVILFLSSALGSLSLAGCQPGLSVTLLCWHRLSQAKHRVDLLLCFCMLPLLSLSCSHNSLPHPPLSSAIPIFHYLTPFSSWPHLYLFLLFFPPNLTILSLSSPPLTPHNTVHLSFPHSTFHLA